MNSNSFFSLLFTMDKILVIDFPFSFSSLVAKQSSFSITYKFTHKLQHCSNNYALIQCYPVFFITAAQCRLVSKTSSRHSHPAANAAPGPKHAMAAEPSATSSSQLCVTIPAAFKSPKAYASQSIALPPANAWSHCSKLRTSGKYASGRLAPGRGTNMAASENGLLVSV